MTTATIRTIDSFASLMGTDTGFPPQKYVLSYAPSRVSIEAGEVVRVSPSYAQHEGNDGVWYTVRITEVYPQQIERERRIGDTVVFPAQPCQHQFAACDVLACEIDDSGAGEIFRRSGHRTWIQPSA